MTKRNLKKWIVVALVSGLLLSVFLSFSLLSLSSCHPFKQSWSEKIEEMRGEQKAGSLIKSFGKQYNVDEAELTAYDFAKFHRRHLHRIHANLALSSQLHSLRNYNRSFPIESMILLDQDTLCVIYKLALEDGEQTIAYVVFKRAVYEKNDDLCEWWHKNGELYFISEQLQYTDYQSIDVGDSMVSAIEIDPAIEFDMHYVTFPLSLDYKKVTAYRVLTDGILILEFKDDGCTSSTDPSAFTVTQKTFYPYSGTESPEGVSLTLDQIASLIK